MTSMERTMWAIEYVIKHGSAQHLRSPSANLSWSEFFELELVFILVSICVAIVYLVVKTLLFFKRFVSTLILGRREDQIIGKIHLN